MGNIFWKLIYVREREREREREIKNENDKYYIVLSTSLYVERERKAIYELE